MMLKLLAGLAFVAAVVGKLNFEMGKREIDDEQICKITVSKRASYIAIPVYHEETCFAPPDFVINKVKVTNLVSDRIGAEADVNSGGPGKQKVTVGFSSRWFNGIDSFLEVWAIKKAKN